MRPRSRGRGQFIGDAILFHLDEGVFDVVGHPTVANWLQYTAEAGGYDVRTERDENSADRPSGPPVVYRYELQGPTAAAIVEKVTGDSNRAGSRRRCPPSSARRQRPTASGPTRARSVRSAAA